MLSTRQVVPTAGWGTGLGPCPADAHVLWVWSQVSHHPPSAAHYVFSKHGWSLWQEITISSKFRGKYLSIMPLGELKPCAFPGQKAFLDKREGFTNTEASLGPLGVTLVSLQICSPPPQASSMPPWPMPCPQSTRILLPVVRTVGPWADRLAGV